MAKSKVYFSKTITPEKVLEMYQTLGKELTGKIAVKVHSGEVGNQNFLKHTSKHIQCMMKIILFRLLHELYIKIEFVGYVE